MGLKITKGVAPEWFYPTGQDEEDEGAASFKLAPLTGPQLLEVQSFVDQTTLIMKGAGLVLACKLGMRDWRNVGDEKDKPLKCNRFTIDQLPAEVLAECGGRVIHMSVMDEEEIKN